MNTTTRTKGESEPEEIADFTEDDWPVDVTLDQGDEPPEDIVEAEVAADCFEEKVPSDDVAEGEAEPEDVYGCRRGGRPGATRPAEAGGSLVC
jgi:hypothetical protein